MLSFLTSLKWGYFNILEMKRNQPVDYNKKKLLVDQVISFIVVLIIFLIVGMIFQQLSNIRYLFYMVYFTVILSRVFTLYISEKEYMLRHEMDYRLTYALA